MNTRPSDIVSMAHAAKNKRTREQAGLESFDEEEVSPQELQQEQQEMESSSNPYFGFAFDPSEAAEEERKRRAVTTEVKELLIKYPDIDTSKAEKLDMQLACLSTDELECKLENIKIQVGVVSPNEKARSIAGVVGFIFEYYLGFRGFTDRLSNDTQLIGCIDAYLPASLHAIGVPLLTLLCLGGHIADHFNGININQGQRPAIDRNRDHQTIAQNLHNQQNNQQPNQATAGNQARQPNQTAGNTGNPRTNNNPPIIGAPPVQPNGQPSPVPTGRTN